MLVQRQTFSGWSWKLVPTGTKDRHRILGREALDIVEDGIPDKSACAWEYRLQLSSRLLCLTLNWTMLDLLVNLFCCIICEFVWIFCIAQVVIPVCAGFRQQHMWSSFPQMHSALSCLKMRFIRIYYYYYYYYYYEIEFSKEEKTPL